MDFGLKVLVGCSDFFIFRGSPKLVRSASFGSGSVISAVTSASGFIASDSALCLSLSLLKRFHLVILISHYRYDLYINHQKIDC
jgi:hypothetical protein